jgi:hypothetical protein
MEQSGRIALTVRFPQASVAEAGILAEDLRTALLDVHPAVFAERLRTDEANMDFGAALSLLLATPAITAVAKGIQAWLTRHNAAKLRIEGPDGRLIVENLTAGQVLDLAELLHVAQRAGAAGKNG